MYVGAKCTSLKLRIKISPHCLDNKSFITASAKTWQGESMRVSHDLKLIITV